MAIDKNQTKDMLKQIDAMFGAELTGLKISPRVLNWAKEKILGEALGQIRRMVDDARPPVFYLLGRSQHGKSSIINALMGCKVAVVGGGAKPCTRDAIKYEVKFLKRYSQVVLIDSRGIFEITRDPDAKAEKIPTIPPNDEVEVRTELVPGDVNLPAETVAIKQIQQCRPDIILHVVAITDVANVAPDIEILKTIHRQYNTIPVVVVLTRTDSLNPVDEWPPESSEDKRQATADHVQSMARWGIGQGQQYKKIPGHEFYQGCELLGDSPFLYVIPVNVPSDKHGNPRLSRHWNIDLLKDILDVKLPEAARLEYLQACQRKERLQELSSGLIRRFSGIAGGIGIVPDFGMSDFIVLTPMQLVMIAAIGGLSCRPASKETAKEYLAACGVALGGGLGLRVLGSWVASMFPVLLPIKAAIAASGTYAIGKSAETYFFSGEIRKPEKFKDEYEPPPI